MAEGLSLRAYARHRGVSLKAVQKAVASRRITLTPEGKVEPETADAAWAANTDPTKPRNSVTGNPKHRRVPGEPSTPMSSGPSNGPHEGSGEATRLPSAGGEGYVTARTRRENIRARREWIALERDTGALISADEVRAACFAEARRARDRLRALPAELAPVVALLSDPRECERAIQKLIDIVCDELSDS